MYTEVLAEGAAPVNSGDAAWMLISAALVFLMTPALAFFYGGMSRRRSVLNMMMMSFGAIGVTAVVFILWGWSMSYGGQSIAGLFANPLEMFGLKGVIGESGQWAASTSGSYPAVIDVVFQLAFAVIAVALVSGALAERTKFATWLAFAAVWVTLCYFTMAHMVWGGGLLSDSETGLAARMFGVTDGEATIAPVDFAGGTVIHINAGMAALVLAILIGKRAGFGTTAYRPHNLPYVMLGAALLCFGWFGFNAGSAFAADGAAGLALLNTVAAAAAAMLGWLAAEWKQFGHATSLGAASGMVAGLVAITPAAGSVHPVGALAIGVIAGALSAVAVDLKFRFGFDDSLDVVGVHLVSGLWGTVAVGLFATGSYDTTAGLFYDLSTGWKLLIVQTVIALIALVVSGIGTVVCYFLLRPLGWRIDSHSEQVGIDSTEHAETAYEDSTLALPV